MDAIIGVIPDDNTRYAFYGVSSSFYIMAVPAPAGDRAEIVHYRRPIDDSAALRAGEAATVEILMNTRGLMELVILNIGLEIGIVSPALFAMMVLMALVTTFMTTPLLDRVYPEPLRERARQMSVAPAGDTGEQGTP